MVPINMYYLQPYKTPEAPHVAYSLTCTAGHHTPTCTPAQYLSYRCTSQPCSHPSLHDMAQPSTEKPVHVMSPTCMPAAFSQRLSTCTEQKEFTQCTVML